jgi:hypothetical protein
MLSTNKGPLYDLLVLNRMVGPAVTQVSASSERLSTSFASVQRRSLVVSEWRVFTKQLGWCATAANGRNPPIVLKNWKNPHSHFSAKIRYIGKADHICAERAAGDAHIAKALIWPTSWPKFPTGALWRSF